MGARICQHVVGPAQGDARLKPSAAGAAGIVFGGLALLGIASRTVTSVALIAFGVAMVLSSNSVWAAVSARALVPSEGQSVFGSEMFASERASESAVALTSKVGRHRAGASSPWQG